MVGNSFSSAKNADAVLLIADGRFPEPGSVERKLMELLKDSNKKDFKNLDVKRFSASCNTVCVTLC